MNEKIKELQRMIEELRVIPDFPQLKFIRWLALGVIAVGTTISIGEQIHPTDPSKSMKKLVLSLGTCVLIFIYPESIDVVGKWVLEQKWL